MKKILILIIALFVYGCASNHASKSFLYKDVSGAGKYELVKYRSKVYNDHLWYSSNPIFIANDSKFSIKLDDVYVGKLKQKIKGSPGKSKKNKELLNNIKDKELWLLTTITSLNPNDPLETNSKLYFKSTNVKVDSQSFSFFPLDEEEKYVFTHESDMSYRITFQMYSVEKFALKRELAKVAKSPGVSGIIKDGWSTLASTFGSLVGDIAVNYFKSKSEEPLATERFLLKADATLEFYGQITILRNNAPFDNSKNNYEPDAGDVNKIYRIIKILDSKTNITEADIRSAYTTYKDPFILNSYMLYDNFAPDSNCSTNYTDDFDDEEYNDCDDFEIGKKSTISGSGYVAFSVMEAHSPKLTISPDNDIINFEKYQNVVRIVEKISDSFKLVKEIENRSKIFESECTNYVASKTLSVDEVEKNPVYAKCALLEEDKKILIAINKVTTDYYKHFLVSNQKLGGINATEWKDLLLRPSD